MYGLTRSSGGIGEAKSVVNTKLVSPPLREYQKHRNPKNTEIPKTHEHHSVYAQKSHHFGKTS